MFMRVARGTWKAIHSAGISFGSSSLMDERFTHGPILMLQISRAGPLSLPGVSRPKARSRDKNGLLLLRAAAKQAVLKPRFSVGSPGRQSASRWELGLHRLQIPRLFFT